MSARILSFSLDLLRKRNAPSVVYVVERQRSSYYKNDQKTYVPRFIRVFFYRHPKAPFGIVLALCILAVTQPYWKVYYARCVMHQQDYIDYRREANRVFLNRGRHGEDLYIPFVNPDKTDPIYERYMQRTRDRKAGLYVDPEPRMPPTSS